MKRQCSSRVAWQEDVLSLLQQLQQSLQECCVSLAQFDLDRAEAWIARQQSTCSEMKQLLRQQKVTAKLVDMPTDSTFVEQLLAKRRDILHWNRVYSRLLNRSRQSCRALAVGLLSLTGSYVAPGQDPLSALPLPDGD